MNNPFDYTPSAECEEAFEKLTQKLESLKASNRPEDVNFCRELEEGKMLGVLIAEDDCGHRHTLYAFSGQLGSHGFYHPGFVAPVFDYLKPDGYFKIKEAEISRQNEEISEFQADELSDAKRIYEEAKERADEAIRDFKEKCRLSKLDRDAKRASGDLSEEELATMIGQSQFEKAEQRRVKKRFAKELQPFEENFTHTHERLNELKHKRSKDSEELQKWLFTNFRVLNAQGESKSLWEIFSETSLRIPPSGAGECCAPKLLQAAYLKGLHPVAMAEYWYGHPKGGEVRIHGRHYPACRGKCLPILKWMLQGVEVHPPIEGEAGLETVYTPEIIYENDWFCVVNKPAGMLSVPGKSAAISVQQWLIDKYGSARGVKAVHRLDQDTSGLLIATFGEIAYKVMQSLFATRRVNKTYIAELEGDYHTQGLATKGRIELPLSPDLLDRPRQKVDFESGKESLTDYEFSGIHNGRSRIIFHPLTGRTHQLRVHAASTQGLGLPIAGDRLYGKTANTMKRLHLHAHRIEFTFPLDGKKYTFTVPVPF